MTDGEPISASDFDRARILFGSEYLAHKQRLVDGPRASVRARLQELRGRSKALPVSDQLRVDALILALDDPETCRAVHEELEGKLDSLGEPPPHLGMWSAHRRGEHVATRGSLVGARLFELVGVSQEVSEGTAHVAAFVALGLLSDPEAATVLAELLSPVYPLASRTAAASAIGHRGQRGANERLAELLSDTHEEDSLRAACAESLGLAQASSAIPLLVERLLSPSESVGVRAGCASSIAALDPAAARTALCQVLDSAAPVALALELIRHLQLIGDATCLPTLDRLALGGGGLLAALAGRCATRVRARNGRPATLGSLEDTNR